MSMSLGHHMLLELNMLAIVKQGILFSETYRLAGYNASYSDYPFDAEHDIMNSHYKHMVLSLVAEIHYRSQKPLSEFACVLSPSSQKFSLDYPFTSTACVLPFSFLCIDYWKCIFHVSTTITWLSMNHLKASLLLWTSNSSKRVSSILYIWWLKS